MQDRRGPGIATTLWTAALLTLLAIGSTAQAQQELWRSLDVNGATRQYLVYLPTGFDPAENMPVLFGFHGGDDTPQGMMEFYGDFRPLADQHRFIAVYPAAAVDGDGCRCWNTEGPFDNGIDDVEFADAMIDAVVAEFGADPDRIYACGFSLGGSMMWELACYLGDHFAAIGVVAANMWRWTRDACSPGLPTGIVHILGTNDFYAPYDGNEWSLSVSEQNAYWVSVNGAETVPSETDLGGGVTQYVYGPGDGCHTVEHFKRQGGGHDWPSFANDAIWDYVSQFNNSGLIECDDPADVEFPSDSSAPAADARLTTVAPNPFHASTGIAFTLGEAQLVRLRVIDVTGRVVRTLIDARLDADQHQVRWDGRDDAGREQATGLYFAELATSSGTHRASVVRLR